MLLSGGVNTLWGVRGIWAAFRGVSGLVPRKRRLTRDKKERSDIRVATACSTPKNLQKKVFLHNACFMIPYAISWRF